MKCESCGLLFGLSPTTKEDIVIPWQNMVSWCDEYSKNECFDCHVKHVTREHMIKVPFRWKRPKDHGHELRIAEQRNRIEQLRDKIDYIIQSK